MNEHAQLRWLFIKTESSKSQRKTYMKMENISDNYK